MSTSRTTIPLASLHPLKRACVEFHLQRHDGLRVERIDAPGRPSTFVMVLRDGTELPCDFPEPEGGGVGEFVMGAA